MKKRLAIFCACLAIFAGCSNHDIDTAKVRAAFPALNAEGKAWLDEGLADIDAGKYSDSIRPLRRLAFAAKLDKNQRDILQDTILKAKAKSKS